MHARFADRCLATILLIGAIVLSGCAVTPPAPAASSVPQGPSAGADPPSDPASAPASAPLTTGAVACPDIADCIPALTALKGIIPEPLPDGQVLVIARACPAGQDCRTGVHAMAVLVPRSWRLGDPLTGAWSVDGVEGSVTVTPWPVPSLPEDVASVVRAWVGGN